MAEFKKNVGNGEDVVCTVPPAYTQSNVQEKPSKRPLVFLFGAVTITAIIVAGVVLMVHLLTNGDKDTGDHINAIYNIQSVETTYMYRGVNMTQTMSMSRNSDTISMHNHEDNFDVILDYKRNLAIFKNLSSNTCYFTNLGDIPFSTVGADDVWTVAPILFPENDQGMNAMAMLVQTELPPDFVSKATDEKVGMMCSGGKSFWVDSTGQPEDDTRVKRQVQETTSNNGQRAAGCITASCKLYYLDGSCSGWFECKVIVLSPTR